MTINFDGVMYNPLPRVLALDSVGSRADGNDTLLIVDRIGGNLGTGAATLGTLFGLIIVIFALVLRYDPEARGPSGSNEDQ